MPFKKKKSSWLPATHKPDLPFLQSSLVTHLLLTNRKLYSLQHFKISFLRDVQFIIKIQHKTISILTKRLINNFSPVSLFSTVFVFFKSSSGKIWITALRCGHARSCSEYGGLHLIESEESPIKIPWSNGWYGSYLVITLVCCQWRVFSVVCLPGCD